MLNPPIRRWKIHAKKALWCRSPNYQGMSNSKPKDAKKPENTLESCGQNVMLCLLKLGDAFCRPKPPHMWQATNKRASSKKGVSIQRGGTNKCKKGSKSSGP